MRVHRLLNRLNPRILRSSRAQPQAHHHHHHRSFTTAAKRLGATTMAATHLTLSAEPAERKRAEHWTDDEGTGFRNPWPSARGQPPMSDVAKFMWSGLFQSHPEHKNPRSFISSQKPDFTPPTEGVKATWLGHAAVLVQFALPSGKGSINVLFDPVFSERCGPGGVLGPKRFTAVPCGDVAGLPEIDVVALSHNHYDHLDLHTLKHLFTKQQSRPPALLAPLNTWRVLDGAVPGSKDVYREADWWETISVGIEGKGSLSFTCTPAQHMTARTAFDQAKSLWGGWAVVGDAGSAWFAGDTGYAAVDTETHEIDPAVPTCPAFKQIGERFGGFDLAFIPIGAYAPRWFLSTVHCAPIDAVRVFQDVKAKKAMAIHWGTWDLSHEPLAQPLELLREAREVVGLTADEFDVVDIGASIVSGGEAAVAVGNGAAEAKAAETEPELQRAVA